MYKKKFNLGLVSSLFVASFVSGCMDTQKIEAKNKLPEVIESPSATKVLEKDWLGAPTKYEMPKDCVSTDKNAVARGEFYFHNLSGETAKKHEEKAKALGVSLNLPSGEAKPFGNCLACHNIEKAEGAGNIGPDLTKYREYFVDSGARDAKWVYQQIADPRVHEPKTLMTTNLTSKLFNEREICDIVSYLLRK